MKFSKSHEWVNVEHDVAMIGISDYAQKELGEVVYVELPKIGQTLQAGETAVVLESTKAAVDIDTPLSGVVTEINIQLQQQPELINHAPQTTGWLFKLRLQNAQEAEALMSEADYLHFIGS